MLRDHSDLAAIACSLCGPLRLLRAWQRTDAISGCCLSAPLGRGGYRGIREPLSTVLGACGHHGPTWKVHEKCHFSTSSTGRALVSALNGQRLKRGVSWRETSGALLHSSSPGDSDGASQMVRQMNQGKAWGGDGSVGQLRLLKDFLKKAKRCAFPSISLLIKCPPNTPFIPLPF